MPQVEPVRARLATISLPKALSVLGNTWLQARNARARGTDEREVLRTIAFVGPIPKAQRRSCA